jgi:hypothetical protein
MNRTHNFHAHLCLIVFFAAGYAGIAQCPVCVPDQSCVSSDGFPAICPDVIPDAVAGEYYEQVITFYLPAEITDPESGLTADLLQLDVNSVSGLPFGMAFTLDDEDGVFYPGQGQNAGCATLCGTPVLPGAYDVAISVTAYLQVGTFSLTQDELFTFTLIVAEGEGGTDSFEYDNLAGCGQLEVTFEPTLSGIYPQLTTYSWDFGNETYSTTAGPQVVFYDSPGTYQVSLQTVISNLVLDAVSVQALDDNGNSDLDELLTDPDPYFELRDGANTLVYTSGILDNVIIGSWTVPDIVLSNPPYSLTFWDDDLISQNDLLGQAALILEEGQNDFDTGTGTIGQASVHLDEQNNITSTTEVSVFAQPEASFSVTDNVFTCSDSGLTSYSWTLNDEILDGAISCQLEAQEGGWYQMEVINAYGCSAWSEPYLYCPALLPVYTLITDVISVPDGFTAYQWSFNGLELEGADTYFISNPENGNYSVTVETDYGCTIESEVITLALGIDEEEGKTLHIYPQPADTWVWIDVPVHTEGEVVIRDALGRICQTGLIDGVRIRMSVESLAPGWYSIVIGHGPSTHGAAFWKQ